MFLLEMRNCIFSDKGSDYIAAGFGTKGIEPTPYRIDNCLSGNSTLAHIPVPIQSNLIEGVPVGFVDAAHGDFHVLPSSPAINAGKTRPGDPTTNLDGLSRNQLGFVDLGCFEVQPGHEDPGPVWTGTVSDLMGGVARRPSRLRCSRRSIRAPLSGETEL